MRISQTHKKELLEKVVGVAGATGIKLFKRQKKLKDLRISHKEAQGVVSNADIEAEDFLITKLRPLIKNASFLAEESAFKKYGGKSEYYKKYSKEEWVWIIDPLDGTTNYLNNMDYYAVCICLAHFGEPLIAVIHRPNTHQTYTAVKGMGATIVEPSGRKRKLKKPESKKKLKDSLLVTGFACEKGEVFKKEFEIFKRMMKESRGIRRMGSAALDLCLVAEGIFDGFWERGLSPWDTAAAALICEEAGYKVTDYNNKTFDPFKETIVAGRKELHQSMLDNLK